MRKKRCFWGLKYAAKVLVVDMFKTVVVSMVLGFKFLPDKD